MNNNMEQVRGIIGQYVSFYSTLEQRKALVNPNSGIIEANTLCTHFFFDHVGKPYEKASEPLGLQIVEELNQLFMDDIPSDQLKKIETLLSEAIKVNQSAMKVLPQNDLMVAVNEKLNECLEAVKQRLEAEIEEHLNALNGLTTRDELYDWIIKYQYLTDPNGSPICPVKGTAGAGLAKVISSIRLGETLRVFNNAATAALVRTLQELSEKDKLHILNGNDGYSFHKLQKVETKHHLRLSQELDEAAEGGEAVETYGFTGKALTYVPVWVRTVTCHYFSRM